MVSSDHQVPNSRIPALYETGARRSPMLVGEVLQNTLQKVFLINLDVIQASVSPEYDDHDS